MSAYVKGIPEAIANLKMYQIIKTQAIKDRLKKQAFKIELSAKEMCLHPRSKVLTNDGWKQIRTLNIGDLVVTESGQIKPIERIIKSKPTEYIRLYMQTGSSTKYPEKKGNFYSLTGDPNHLIKTENGWEKFGDIKEGENIFYLASKCKECGKLCRFHLDFCSRKCQGKWRFKNGIGIKGLEIGHARAKEFANKRDSKTSIEKWKKWRQENPEKVKEYHKRQGKTLAKFYQKYPEKHPNAICAKNHFFSKLEKKTEKLLQKLNIDYIHQYKAGKYWVDFALPDLKILLECDGEHWHKDKNKETKRDEEIKKIHPEWNLTHLNENEILNLTANGLSQYLSYGLGDIEFIKAKIIKIKRTKIHKYIPYFIDLVIDNGNGTFIANGFLVHNCPVDTGRLRASISTNWAGSPMNEGKTGGKAKSGDGVKKPAGPKELVYVVGTNVEYSEDVEHGTKKREATPYLFPAYFMYEGETVAAIAMIMKKDVRLK